MTTAESLAATEAESPFCVNAECGNLALSACWVCVLQVQLLNTQSQHIINQTLLMSNNND